MPDVKQNIVGNSDDAQQAVDRLRAKFEKLELAMRNNARFSKQSAQAGSQIMNQNIRDLQNMVLQIFSIQKAWQLAKGALDIYAEGNRKVQALRGGGAIQFESELRAQQMGRFSDKEMNQVREAVQSETARVPIQTIEQTMNDVVEMLSQNIDRNEIMNGKAIRDLLEVRLATGEFGSKAGDPKELITAFTTLIRNLPGRDPTAEVTGEEIRTLGGKFKTLSSMSVTVQDAEFLARITGILDALKMSTDMQMATFAVARDTFGSGEVAATMLRQAAVNMTRAGSQDMAKKLAKKGIEGIDGTQFDLIGEDFVEALRNFGKQIEKLDDRQKADAIDAMFGVKAGTGILGLLKKPEVITKAYDLLQNRGESERLLQEGVRVGMKSPFIAQQTPQAELDIKAREGVALQNNMTMEQVEKILDAAALELKANGTAYERFGLSMNRTLTNLENMFMDYTPQEYLNRLTAGQENLPENLRSPERDTIIGAVKMAIEQANPGTDEELEKARKEYRDILEQIRLNGPRKGLADRAQEAEKYLLKLNPDEELVLPEQQQKPQEKIEVEDPDLHASVNRLNDTMDAIFEVLNTGPDRQRVLRVPRTQGTA